MRLNVHFDCYWADNFGAGILIGSCHTMIRKDLKMYHTCQCIINNEEKQCAQNGAVNASTWT